MNINIVRSSKVESVLQPDGKARRAKAKTILLGITYGMSAHSLAEKMDLSQEEAEKIIDDFYKGFEGVKKLTDDSQTMLKKVGYVTDMWGRRRHLPDAQLPEFEVAPMNSKSGSYEFNPLLGAVQHEDKALQAKINYYKDKLSKAKWKKEIDQISLAAKKEGFSVKSNRGFINRSLRQCLNARIQGTAASMTKNAMIMIHNDEELNKLGARLLVTVHDEVFMEAPSNVSEQVAKRLSEVMVAAAADKCVCKFKCDPYICVDGWYEDEASGGIRNDYNKCIKTMTINDALNKMCDKYSMFNSESIKLVCEDAYEIGRDSLKYGPCYYRRES